MTKKVEGCIEDSMSVVYAQSGARGFAMRVAAVLCLSLCGLRFPGAQTVEAERPQDVGFRGRPSAPPQPDTGSYEAHQRLSTPPPTLELPPTEAPVNEAGEPLSRWDPLEYQLLSSGERQTTDVLSTLPEGNLSLPAKPLAMEEILAANRPEEAISYTPEQVGLPTNGQFATGKKKKGGLGGLTFPSSPTKDLGSGTVQIDSPEYLDYDEEHHMIYGHGRSTIHFGAMKIQADRVMIDTRLREIQAFGNAVISGEQQFIEAESLWVNSDTGEAIAYNTRGRTGSFYFLADPFCNEGRTNFRQLSKDEALLKESSFTTCDFPVPHYRIHAKEFNIFSNDRIYARNVIVYIWEKPVLWLPSFTLALHDENPWGVSIGSDTSLGFFLRVWYDFYHTCWEPSEVDDTTMERAGFGHARIRTDWFSKRGFGQGLHYDYFFGRGENRGELDLYHINDTERDVKNNTEQDRYYVNWFHRFKINPELSWMADVDYPSDPDIFYDIFDRFGNKGIHKRDRLPERHAAFGWEWTTDDFFAGLQVELKDRIGRDRVSNFQDPLDNDGDFDRRFNDETFFTLNTPGQIGPGENGVPFVYPNAGTYSNEFSNNTNFINLDNGVSHDRYGHVTERLPQLTVSSNRIRILCLPLWYHVDLNVINNLDKGLNTVSTKDDSFVSGFDLYQSVSHLLKFCDRYTLLTKVGLGVGVAERWDKSYNLDFPNGAQFPFVMDGWVFNNHVQGLTFLDKDTFLIGTKKMSLKDVKPEFVYGDIDSLFTARVCDQLTAWVRYRLREGSKDTLGEFYEKIGSVKTRDDLYAFRNREHWLEAGLTYNLLIPRLNANAAIGKNLQGTNDITPNELLQYANFGVGWSNLRNTILLNTGVSLQQRQLRDPTDPNEFVQNSTTYYAAGTYIPVHQRYYGRLAAYIVQNKNNDPLGNPSNDDIHEFDTNNDAVLDWTIGRKIGSKYLVEYSAKLRSNSSGINDQVIRIQRDMHDMIAGLSIGIKGSSTLSSSQENTKQDNFQMKLNFRFKQAADKGVLPVSRQNTLFNSSKTGAYETSTGG